MRAALALVAALWLAGCATQPAIDLSRADLDGWLELRARDFTLVGDLPEADLRRHAEDLSILVAVAMRLTTVSLEPSRLPVLVVLAPSGVYRTLVPWTTVAGVAATKLDGHYLVVGLEGSNLIDRHVLLHEYTHFLSHKNRSVRYPSWYSEGFAEMLSTVHRREDVVRVGAAPYFRIETLRRTEKTDLSAVLGVETGDTVDADLFYAQAWATTHYLSEKPERRSQLRSYFALLREGKPWNEAVPQAFGIGVEELSARVDAHLRNIIRGVPPEIAVYPLSALALDGDWQVRPLSAAEVATRLAEFPPLDEGARADAVSCAYFARARAADPGAVHAQAGSALCAARDGHFAAAERGIERARAAAPQDARIAVTEGRIQELRASAEPAAAAEARFRAHAAYVAATELAPSDPVAWAALGTSYADASGDLQPGIDALERVRALGGWDADVNLTLARLLMRAGRRDVARERLAEIVRLADGDPKREAEQLLAELAAKTP